MTAITRGASLDGSEREALLLAAKNPFFHYPLLLRDDFPERSKRLRAFLPFALWNDRVEPVNL